MLNSGCTSTIRDVVTFDQSVTKYHNSMTAEMLGTKPDLPVISEYHSPKEYVACRNVATLVRTQFSGLYSSFKAHFEPCRAWHLHSKPFPKRHVHCTTHVSTVPARQPAIPNKAGWWAPGRELTLVTEPWGVRGEHGNVEARFCGIDNHSA